MSSKCGNTIAPKTSTADTHRAGTGRGLRRDLPEEETVSSLRRLRVGRKGGGGAAVGCSSRVNRRKIELLRNAWQVGQSNLPSRGLKQLPFPPACNASALGGSAASRNCHSAITGTLRNLRCRTYRLR